MFLKKCWLALYRAPVLLKKKQKNAKVNVGFIVFSRNYTL